MAVVGWLLADERCESVVCWNDLVIGSGIRLAGLLLASWCLSLKGHAAYGNCFFFCPEKDNCIA